MIRFPCPACGASLSAPDTAAGRNSNCTGCRAAVTVPVVATPVPAQRVVVNVPEAEPPPENLAPRLAVMAALLWVIVFFAALIFTAFSAWLGVRALLATAQSSDGNPGALVITAALTLQLWFYVIVGGFITAYALDRISQ